MNGAHPPATSDKIRLLREAKTFCEDLADSRNELLANRALLARWHLRNVIADLEAQTRTPERAT